MMQVELPAWVLLLGAIGTVFLTLAGVLAVVRKWAVAWLRHVLNLPEGEAMATEDETVVSHDTVLQTINEFREALTIDMQTGFARVENLERKVENGLLDRTAALERGQAHLSDKLDGACERLARIEGKLDATR